MNRLQAILAIAGGIVVLLGVPFAVMTWMDSNYARADNVHEQSKAVTRSINVLNTKIEAQTKRLDRRIIRDNIADLKRDLRGYQIKSGLDNCGAWRPRCLELRDEIAEERSRLNEVD